MFIWFLSEFKKPVEESVPKMVAQKTEETPQKGKRGFFSFSLCHIF